MEFSETEFDFTVPLEPKEEPTAEKSTKKSSKTVKKVKKNKHQESSNPRKTLKESESSNEQKFDPLEIPMPHKSKKLSETSSEQQQISPLEILDDIKQMQGNVRRLLKPTKMTVVPIFSALKLNILI